MNIEKYNRLTVISRERQNAVCVCECGTTITVQYCNLKTGNTKSCGCLRKEVLSQIKSTHRKSHTPIHNAWLSMKDRCNDKTNKDYGGRGIKVCRRWRNSFDLFFKDMGDLPFKGAQLDRVRNNEDYKPGNVKWSTALENSLNRRSSVRVNYLGECNSLSVFAKRCDIAYKTVFARVARGWTVEQALTTPLKYNAK